MLIPWENDEKYLRNLEAVLKRLKEHGLKANKEKYKFLQEEVVFCGLKLDTNCQHKTQNKFDAIYLNAPVLEDNTQ